MLYCKNKRTSRAAHISIEDYMNLQTILKYCKINKRSFINWTKYVLKKLKENNKDKKLKSEYTFDPVLLSNLNPYRVTIFTTKNKLKNFNFDKSIWEDLPIIFGVMPG